jgi:arginase
VPGVSPIAYWLPLAEDQRYWHRPMLTVVGSDPARSVLAVPWYMGEAVSEFALDAIPELTVEVREGPAVERITAVLDHLAGWVSTHLPAAVEALDCMAPMGVLAGLQRAGLDPDLIWIDAHGDFNTWETTPSGYLGGMPLAMLVGRGDQAIVKGLRMATISESRVTLVGARDLDPGEAEALAGSKLRRVTAAEALHMELPTRAIHVHLDVDVVDPAELPGLLYPATGGPGITEVTAVLRHLASAPNLAAISIAHTYDQRADTTAAARRAASDLVRAVVP